MHFQVSRTFGQKSPNQCEWDSEKEHLHGLFQIFRQVKKFDVRFRVAIVSKKNGNDDALPFLRNRIAIRN
jgi:hypothetical protein